jgi:hypothetical protein
MVERRTRLGLRLAGAALVIAWFVSDAVRTRLPFWVPFAVLLAAEVEFVVRGLVERRQTRADPVAHAPRRLAGPDDHDADLGWGRLVEDLDKRGEPVVRWIPPPPRPRGRRSAGLYLGAAAVAVGLFVLAYRSDAGRSWSSLAPDTRRATEARLRQEATRIAGRPVLVRCDDSYAFTGLGSDVLGVAFPRRLLTFLQPSVCRTLHDAITGDRPENDDAGEAVLVLAHEAVHLRGERREGVTECLGLQEGVPLAVRLGWSRAAAERLMRRRYEAILSERSITRLSYALPSGCREQGSLDRRPDDSTFP